MKDNKWKLTQQMASNIVVVFAGILFYVGLSHFDQVRATMSGFVHIIMPFIWGLVIAYLLDGPARYFERTILKKYRGLAILLSYVLAVLLLGFLGRMVIPQLVQSVVALLNNVPVYLEHLNDLVVKAGMDTAEMEQLIGSYQELVQKAAAMISSLLPKLLGYGVAIGSGVINAFTAIIASVYMLLSKEKLVGQLRKLVVAFAPQRYATHILDVCRNANGVFSGFINGKLIDSAIIGVICFVVTTLLKTPFALLISVIVGVTNIIPFFGPFIGAIPSIMILLIVDPWSALEFAIFVIILQQFDGNILGPKILGDSTGLPALWVLVAIIVGGGLFGFAGMVVGVPTFAVLYSLGSDFITRRLKHRGYDRDCKPLVQVQAAQPEEKTDTEKGR